MGLVLGAVRRQVDQQRLTVLVTHWWEYFPQGIPDEAFIAVLHEAMDYLARTPGLRVVSFDEVADGSVSLG